jgi:hypothetical protein
LKFLLVKAGLKFDVNGNLCLFSENNEKIENETYLERLFRAFKELKIILTASIKDHEDFEEIVKEQNMESAKKTADKISNMTASLEVTQVEVKDGKKVSKIFSIVLKLGDVVKKVLNWFKSKFTIKEEVVEGWGDEDVESNDQTVTETPKVEKPEDEVIVEVNDADVEQVIINDGALILDEDVVPVSAPKIVEPKKVTVPAQQTATRTTNSGTLERLKRKHGR